MNNSIYLLEELKPTRVPLRTRASFSKSAAWILLIF